MSTTRVLTLAEGVLHTPNGVSKALCYLEAEARTRVEIGTDARVWACIAHLRRKQGDVTGGDEAENRARELAEAQIPPRKLCFEAETRSSGGIWIGREAHGGRMLAERNMKCAELLKELGAPVVRKQGRVERLLERTRRLKRISEGLLDGEVGGKVEYG